MRNYKTINGLHKAYNDGRISKGEMEKQLFMLYIKNDNMVNTQESYELFNEIENTLFIDEDDINDFNALPDTVTLYRGQNTEDLDGISWTTEYEIAKKFAFRHKMSIKDVGVGVLKMEIPKTDIKAYTNNRNEKECIITNLNNSEWVECWE